MKFKAIKALRLSAVAVMLTAFAYGGTVLAAEKGAEKPKAPANCRAIKTEAECTPREDCTWRDAAIIKKTGKKRRASCAAKPKAKPAPKAKAG